MIIFNADIYFFEHSNMKKDGWPGMRVPIMIDGIAITGTIYSDNTMVKETWHEVIIQMILDKEGAEWYKEQGQPVNIGKGKKFNVLYGSEVVAEGIITDIENKYIF